MTADDRTERGNARLLTDIAQQQPETTETVVRSGGSSCMFPACADGYGVGRFCDTCGPLAERLRRLVEVWDDSADVLGPEWIGIAERIEAVRNAVACECDAPRCEREGCQDNPTPMTDAERLAEPFAAGLLDATHILESSSE